MKVSGIKMDIHIHYFTGRLCGNGYSHPLFCGSFMWECIFFYLSNCIRWTDGRTKWHTLNIEKNRKYVWKWLIYKDVTDRLTNNFRLFSCLLKRHFKNNINVKKWQADMLLVEELCNYKHKFSSKEHFFHHFLCFPLGW